MKNTWNYPIALAASLLISISVIGSGCTEDKNTSSEKSQALYEKAYIYALPIIMSYKTMYAYAIDEGGANFKAPFNQIKNTARVYGPKDTAVVSAKSDTPYSLLWMDLRVDSKNKYTLTFDMKDLPPVTQFWSIPIYNKEGYFVNNAINRFTINSFMLEQKQLNVENGKLTIYVQNEKPADPKQLKNWLPAPKGEFRFTARFYGPKMSIIDGSYKMPQPVKVK